MVWIRAAWWALAAMGALFAVWFAWDSVGWLSLSCGKTGELAEAGTRPGASCDDSGLFVFGTWPMVRLGLILMAPPIVAALVMRWWASGLVVVALIGLTVVGVMHWTDFWGRLIIAGFPMTAVAAVIALGHLGVTAFRDWSTSRLSEAPGETVPFRELYSEERPG